MTALGFGVGSILLSDTERVVLREVPALARVAVGESFVFLVGAAMAAITVAWPVTYHAAKIEDLRRLLENRYQQGEESLGQLRVSEMRIKALEWARKVNDKKAWLVTAAMAFLAVGVFLLGAAIIYLLALAE